VEKLKEENRTNEIRTYVNRIAFLENQVASLTSQLNSQGAVSVRGVKEENVEEKGEITTPRNTKKK